MIQRRGSIGASWIRCAAEWREQPDGPFLAIASAVNDGGG
jgi:hypothetical protein